MTARWRLLLPCALLLAACGGSFFKTKAAPPTLYLLSARGAATDAGTPAPMAADLAVLKPRVRAGLDTDRIAALYPDRHLDYFADVRWSGPLDEIVQDLAVQAFRSSGAMRNVTADASAFASAYWLEIEVTDFEAEYPAANAAPIAAPVVHVHFMARIGNSGDRHILGRFEADARQSAADNRMGAIVDAYNRAAGQALAQMVADAAAALKEK